VVDLVSVHRVSDCPCFYPLDTDAGHAFEYGDGVPHFATADKCGVFITDVVERHQDVDTLRPVPGDAPCWEFECDGCGEDSHTITDGYASHFASRADAIRGAWAHECRVKTSGRVFCSPECEAGQ
jgi:hypothetical protein